MSGIRIPVLMYHEVGDSADRGDVITMTPEYIMPVNKFRNQMMFLCTHGYRSLLFDEIEQVEGDRYVIITFDDGWAGNFSYVYPMLVELGLKATFFISVNDVGHDGFMDWEQLREMRQKGMSLQSHGLSHRPLEVLSAPEIHRELYDSKRILEGHIGCAVDAISFPHGSYNAKIIDMAVGLGYRVLCTSDVRRVYLRSFLQKPAIVGRIPMKRGRGLSQFQKLLKYSLGSMFLEESVGWLKKNTRSIVGIENYRRFYRWYFSIKKPGRAN